MIEQAKSSTAALLAVSAGSPPESPIPRATTVRPHARPCAFTASDHTEITADGDPQRVSAVATADGSAGSLARAGRRIGADVVKTATLAGDIEP
jgi:hypothetical protein